MPIEQMDPCPVHSISCRVHGPGPFIRLVVERMDPSSENKLWCGSNVAELVSSC